MGIGSQIARQRAVFLDRDGVLNQAIIRDGKPYPPKNLSELKILPGVKAALEVLKKNQWLLVVVTNQPDVARGAVAKDSVEAINDRLKDELSIDEFLTCFHDTSDQCDCRKPEPGFLLLSAERYGLNLSECYMVGDRWRDIEAGERAGCKTVFIDHGYSEKQPVNPNYRVKNLPEAVEKILGEKA